MSPLHVKQESKTRRQQVRRKCFDRKMCQTEAKLCLLLPSLLLCLCAPPPHRAIIQAVKPMQFPPPYHGLSIFCSAGLLPSANPYSYKMQNPGAPHHPTRFCLPQNSTRLVSRLSFLSLPIRDAAHERRILYTATTVRQPGDRSVVAESLELVLHRLRQHGALHVRILRLLGGELRIKVFCIQGIGLQMGVLVSYM